MQVTKLQTNHLTAPIGMGTGPLFLSWQYTDDMRQTAYEIEVTANNKTVWQSGKVQSSAMHADTPAVADSRVCGAWKMARIRVRSAMRASIPLFYEQSPFCSSFSLELYIYKFISYTLLYIEETEVLSLHNRGFFW